MQRQDLLSYLEHCDQVLFQDPQTGLPIAERGVELARRSSNLELEAFALAVLAGAHRLLGDRLASESFFNESLELREYCSPPILGEILKRHSLLLYSLSRFPEGMTTASQAIQIFAELGLAKDQAAALVSRGMVALKGARYGAVSLLPAVSDFAEALRLADPETAPRVVFSAVHNLALAIAEGPARREDLETALEALTHLRPRRGTVPAAKVLWARGLVLRRFGIWPKVERLLLKARDELARLGLPMETTLISLDLAWVFYVVHEDWDALGELAAHASFLFRDRYPLGIRSALTLWRDTIAHRDLTDEILLAIRRTVITGDTSFLERADHSPIQPPAAHPIPEPSPLSLIEHGHVRLAVGPAPGAMRPWKEGRAMNARLAPSDAAALDRIAKRLKTSRSQAVRIAVRDFDLRLATVGEGEI